MSLVDKRSPLSPPVWSTTIHPATIELACPCGASGKVEANSIAGANALAKAFYEAHCDHNLAGPASSDAGGAGDGPDQERSATSPRPGTTTPASPTKPNPCPDCDLNEGHDGAHETFSGSGTVAGLHWTQQQQENV